MRYELRDTKEVSCVDCHSELVSESYECTSP